ncbi:MAG: CPBP family intramembrane metalloprotease [Candidatus Heimdallarchaeota archaeon]|nr:CPBP family intramembrane metalloprotease [Candidatus Heimdallarchaeota archaeon]
MLAQYESEIPPLFDSWPLKIKIILILIILRTFKVYYWITRQVFFLLYPQEEHMLADKAGTELGLLIGAVPVMLFFWCNRSYFKQYFILNKIAPYYILVMIIGSIVILFAILLYSIDKINTVILFPVDAWPERLFFPLFLGLIEELEFRSIFLVQILFFLLKRNPSSYKEAQLQSLLFVSLWFGPIYHLKYFLVGNFVLYVLVFLLGLFNTFITLRSRSIIPAIFLHLSFNLYFTILNVTL